MKQEIHLKELDLIKQWQEKPNEDIALYFFNKYKEDILTINYSKLTLKFSSLPLDREDFFYQVWQAVLSSLKDFDFKNGGTFKNLLIRKTYLSSVKEAVKFIRNNHIILNNSYSYESLLERNKNFKFGSNGEVNIKNDYYIEIKNFIDYVVEFNNKFNPDYVKRIIYLRSLGYTIEEISKKLKQPLKNIKYVLKYIYKISKRLYD